MSRREMVKVKKTDGKRKGNKWVKGQSANPATRFVKGNKAAVGKGRPRKIPGLDAMLDDILGTDTSDQSKAKAHKIINAIAKRAMYGDARAAALIMDRVWGKAPQSLDITTKGDKIETVAPVIKVFNTAPPLAESEDKIDAVEKAEPKKLKK